MRNVKKLRKIRGDRKKGWCPNRQEKAYSLKEEGEGMNLAEGEQEDGSPWQRRRGGGESRTCWGDVREKGKARVAGPQLRPGYLRRIADCPMRSRQEGEEILEGARPEASGNRFGKKRKTVFKRKTR